MPAKNTQPKLRLLKRAVLLAVVLLLLSLDLGSLEGFAELGHLLEARQQVLAAWSRARDSGSYTFTADILQQTIPVATVTNAGRRSQQEALHLEGQTDLHRGEMHFTLWSQGGSVLNAQDGLEVKVEGDRSYVRRGGGDWEEAGDLTGSFAPRGDYLAFLDAATDITRLGEEARAGIPYTRYAFVVDGPRFAAQIRDQLQSYLSQKGELPPGMSLDLPSIYAEMTGSGELWVGADGLPLRQLLWLRFPEQNDQRVQVEVTVDFSRFGLTPAILAARGGVLLQAPWVMHLLFYLALAGLAIAIFIYRRRRAVQAGLALALVTSMVVAPLLQSAQAAAFYDRQSALAGQEQARQEQAGVEQELNDAPWADRFDPHADPLSAEASTPAADHLPSAQALLHSMTLSLDPAAPAVEACDPLPAQHAADSDGDGLTDYQECLLGTNAYSNDSDGDTIPDGDEVHGFDLGGQHWYSDPLSLDSNRDSLPDALEWWVGYKNDKPGDTDGDGTPDLFDDDNDGDGVRDELDLSPFAGGGSPYTRKAPLSLVIDGLTPHQPTFVGFQLRPSNPDQLWYAFNVLDWPYDDQAQMQDVDGATFASATGASDPAAANGDVRLVPMLEIRITGESDNLPPSEERSTDARGDPILDPEGRPVTRTVYPDLEPYGIFVSSSSNGLLAYVPLQLITDPVTGERLAFRGNMLYSPDETWGGAQTVRLVWLVQALVDNVCVAFDEEGECTQRVNNQEQVIHTYYEDWTLTGLSVREEHGSDLAIFYEDPATDPDVENDAGLIGLSAVLDRTFLAGADADNDGKRDYVVIPSAGSTSKPLSDLIADWDLADSLRVQSAGYPTTDRALYDTISGQSAGILSSAFAQYTEVTPTLMFAREDRFRRVNLDQQGEGHGASAVTREGQALTVRMTGQSVETYASLTWAPYENADGEWRAMPLEEYTAQLPGRYLDAQDPAEASPESVVRLLAVQAYYLALYSGVSSHVQSGAALIPQGEPSLPDQGLAENLFAKLYGPGASPKTTAEFALSVIVPAVAPQKLAIQLFSWSPRRATIVREFGDISPQSTSERLSKLGKFSLGLSLALIGSNFAAMGGAGGDTATKVLNVVNSAGDSLLAILDVAEYCVDIATTVNNAAAQGLTKAQAVYEGLAGKTSGVKAGLVGLLVSTAIVWGFFTGQVLSSGLSPGSPAYNYAVAYAVAATFVAVMCFLIGLDPVGAVLLLLVALADAIAGIFCAAGVRCFSILGKFTEFWADIFYGYAEDVTAEITDIAQDQIEKTLKDPELGYQAGNVLNLSSTVSTDIRNTEPSEDFRGEVGFSYYDDYRSASWLDRTGVSYAFNAAPAAPEGGGWDPEPDRIIEYPRPDLPPLRLQLYRGSRDYQAVGSASLSAGINFHPEVSLCIDYTLPGVKCDRILGFVDCDYKPYEGTSNDSIDLVMDVFPASLDGFYQLGARSVGARWDPRFGLQRDYDGDGLISLAFGGIDPDDFKWDADGDGLSDPQEFRLREQGVNLSAGDDNSDGDELLDGEEIRLGTDPYRSDSDGDGLLDHEEVEGWAFEYGPGLTTWVTSDPLVADTDGDGMSDKAERELGSNPRVFNPQPVAVYTALGGALSHGEQTFAQPGDELTYTTRVVNTLDPSLFAAGSLTVSVDPESFATQETPQQYTLDAYGGGEQVFTTGVTVPPDSPSQQATLTNDVLVELPTGQPGSSYLKRLNDYQWIDVGDNARTALAIPTDAGYATDVVAVADEGFQLNLHPATGEGFGTASAVDGYQLETVWDDTQAIAFGDIDGDGDLDVITGNASQPHRLYRNNGGGRDWTASLLPGDGTNTRAIALGDVDSDGDLDMVVANYGQRNQLYRNLGDGEAWEVSDIGNEQDNTTSIALGDVDSDSHLDVVVGNFGQRNRLYRNNGDGSEWAVSDIGGEEDNTTSIALGQIDCNSSLDLVVGNDGQPNLLYRNGGDGGQWTASQIPGNDVADETLSIALGDLNGDARPDVVAGNADADLRISRNPFVGEACDTDPGSWSDLGSASDSMGFHALVLADIDRDGDIDIVAGGNPGRPVLKYMNSGNGTAWSLRGDTSFPIGYSSGGTALAVGNLDGVGGLDLAVGFNSSRPDQVYLNRGIGLTFDPPEGVNISGGVQNTYAVDVGDIDNDGDLDVVAGNYGQRNRLYRNNGDGTQWVASDIAGYGLNTTVVKLCDMDWDGDLDLVVGNSGQPDWLFLNNGDGTQWVPEEITGQPAGATTSIVCGEYGGLPAAFVGKFDGQNSAYVRVCYMGSCEVAASPPIGSADKTQAIALGDVDGDGDIDLVEGNVGKNRVYLRDYVGHDYTWTGLDLTEDAYDTRSIAVGDMDGDGDLDVVAANYNGPDRLYLNAGGGTRWIGSDIDPNAHPTVAVQVADVESDGDLDVIVGRAGDFTAGYYFNGEADRNYSAQFWNNGDNITGLTWPYDQRVPPAYTRSLAVGDMDGDGDLDWVVGSTHDPTTLFKDMTIDASHSLERAPSAAGYLTSRADNSAAVDLACNSAGTCLTVWQRFAANQTFRIDGALVDPGGAAGETFPISSRAFAVNEGFESVSVATDGSDFLVTWSAEGRLYSRMVSREGLPGQQQWEVASLNPTERYLGRLLSQDKNVYEAKMDVAYAGDSGGSSQYVVVWKDRSGSRPILKRVVLTSEGPLPEEVIFTGAPGEQVHFPQVSYDPSGQLGGMLSYRLLPTDETTVFRIQSLPPDGTAQCTANVGISPEFPQVRGLLDNAFDPASGKWMVTYLAEVGEGEEYTTFVQTYGPDCAPGGMPEKYVLDRVHFFDLACTEEECAFTRLAEAGVWRLYLDRFRLQTNSTVQGTLAQQKVDHLWIDNDDPAVTVSDTDIVVPAMAEPSVFTLSGTASDPTSGIRQVQVRQGQGDWISAQGMEAWAYDLSLPAGSGTYGLSIRSEDLFGRLSDPVEATIRVVDPPGLNSDIPDGAAWMVEEDAAGRHSLAGIHGTVTDSGGGVASVEVRVSPYGLGWTPASLDGTNWSVDLLLADSDENGALIGDYSGDFTIEVRASDDLGGTTPEGDYLTRTVTVSASAPMTDLTDIGGVDPLDVVTISQPDVLSGTFSQAESVQVSFTNIQTDPPTFDWQSAEVDPAAGTWSFAIDPAAVPEGFYQIDVSAADGDGERTQPEGAWGQWRGMVDVHAPRVDITIEQAGAGSTTRTHYQLVAHDLNLDEASLVFPPCEGVGVMTRETYDDPWYLAHGGDPAHLVGLTVTCTLQGVPDETAGPDTVLVYDSLGHSYETTIAHHPRPDENPAPTVNAGPEQTAVEGETIALAPASFTDAGTLGPYTATIDWGDGSPIEDGFVTEEGSSRTVDGSHVYLSDGSYTVEVCVTDSGEATGCDSLSVTVQGEAPVVEAGQDQTLPEGDTLTLGSATFTDAGTLGPYTATIDWGDGTAPEAGTVTDYIGSGTVDGSHVYADDGLFTVTIEVTDSGNAAGSDTLQVTVDNAAPTIDAGPDAAIDAGATFTSTGSFTDPGILDTWTATVDYGEGAGEQTLALNLDETFDLEHVYSNSGTYTVTVRVTDDDGGVGVDTLEVTVASQASTLGPGSRLAALTVAQGSRPASLLSTGSAPLAYSSAQDVLNATRFRALENDPPELDVFIFQPWDGSSLIATGPITLRGGAYAVNGLHRLTVLADGEEIATQTWEQAPGVNDAPWTATWTPAEAGVYELTAEVEDWGGSTFASDPITVTVALSDEAPTITIGDPGPVNREVLGDTNVILLAGQAASPVGGIGVTVSVDGGPPGRALLAANDSGVQWVFHWPLSLEPTDLERDYTVTATVTDALGRQAQASLTISVDVLSPEPVDLELLADGQPVAPGETVRQAQASLSIEWTPSSDPGLSGYYAGWTTDAEPDPAVLTLHPPGEAQHAQQVAEPQAFYAHVGVLDSGGNITWTTEGPIYVDGPNTPDYVADLAYHGWTESGCTLIGVDRQVQRSAAPAVALSAEQRMYASWDEDALRLTWTGANWDRDGDLFIYLDTSSGGAGNAFNAYGDGQPTIGLPSGFGADYMVWVEDGATASLRRWNGAWETVEAWDPAAYFRLDTRLSQPHTDILLPLDMLGNPSSLSLVAMASEEDALRLWATVPDGNPHNSPRVISSLAADQGIVDFDLTQVVGLGGFVSGQCPNSGHFTDSDLQLVLSAEPAGVVVSYLANDWLALAPGMELDANRDGVVDLALPVSTPPPLGQGDVVTYTLTYANIGTEAATDVVLHLQASGLSLLDGDTISLDTIDAQATGEVSFSAQITGDAPSAELRVVVSDAVHAAFDWLWALHLVDREGPTEVAIQSPRDYVRSGPVRVSGTAQDASGLGRVTVSVGGVTACEDADPQHGTWSCLWNVPSEDGVTYDLSVVATDVFGHQSTAATETVVVDNTPPATPVLDQTTEDARADGVLVPGEFVLRGTVQDNARAKGVRVCSLDPADESVIQCLEVASRPVGSDLSTGTWMYMLTPYEVEGERQLLDIYGLDAAGNPSSSAERIDVLLDNLGPQIAIDSRRGIVQLGAAPAPVLTGTVTDASGVGEMYAGVQSPSGTQWIPVERIGEAWSLTPAIREVGPHTVRLYAKDGVGNLRGYGPFRFLVTQEAVDFVVEAGPDQTVESGVGVSLPPATFYDADPARSHTAIVQWGDGTTQALALVESEGTGTISGSHLYAADGSYTVVVCVSVSGEDTQACDSFVVTVKSAWLAVGAIPDRTTDEGDQVTLIGTFEAHGTMAPYSATIEWGDGATEPGAASETGGQGTVTGVHTYADNGVYSGALTMSSADGAQAATSFTITVINVAPSVGLSGPASVDEGQTASYSYSVSDPGADTFTLSEQSCGPGAISNTRFDESTGTGGFDCTFSDGPASADVRVAVTDDDGGMGSGGVNVTVNNVAPSVTLNGPTSVDEGQKVSYAFTVIDPGADTFVSSASCGASGPLNPSLDGSAYTGTFECIFPDGPDTSEVQVTVTDDDGGVGTAGLTVSVNNVAPTVEAGDDQSVTEGELLILAATYDDPGTTDMHTVTVDWGDGTQTVTVYDRVSLEDTDGRIAGTYVYADNGDYTVEVCVTDSDDAKTCDSFAASVQNAPPTVAAGSDQTVFEGDTVALDPASFRDPGTLDTHTATIDWGDGNAESATVDEKPYGPPGSEDGLEGTVSGSHTYTVPGDYVVTVTVTDDDGGVGTDTLAVTVQYGFLRFCLYADGPGGLSILHGARVQCEAAYDETIGGGIASRGRLDVGVGATVSGDALSLEDDVILLNGSRVEGDVTAMEDVKLSPNALISGSAISGRDIHLLRGSVIEGDATAGRRLVLARGATVQGTIREHAGLPAIAGVTFVEFQIEVGKQDVLVAPGQIRELDPGVYRYLFVSPHATIVLRSGTYAFRAFTVMRDAKLEFDLSDGPATIEVEHNLFMMPRAQMHIRPDAGSADDITFRIGGTFVQLHRGGSFIGTYLAPHARIILFGDTSLNGALYGKEIQIMPGAQITGEAAANP